VGKDSLSVATACNNLAILYRAQGRFADAEPLYKRAIAIYDGSSGVSNQQFANVLDNYAELLQATSRAEEAKAVRSRASAKIAQS
jgi:tetratricopeptide (TPR) repeat protein